MSAVAIIPARGGSQRIPRKNIRSFCGKPIIAYSVEAARKTGLFDEIIVSTDDKEIAEVAKQYGASVPFMRAAAIADGVTGVMAVVAHALRELGEDQYDNVCMIYAIAPLLRVEDIVAGFEKLQVCAGNVDFVFSGALAPVVFRSFGVQADGTVKMFWPEHYRKNSQNLPEAYHDAAQFCWGRRTAMLEEDAVIFSQRSVPLIIPRYRAVDIDTLEDWRLAELLYRGLRGGRIRRYVVITGVSFGVFPPSRRIFPLPKPVPRLIKSLNQ